MPLVHDTAVSWTRWRCNLLAHIYLWIPLPGNRFRRILCVVHRPLLGFAVTGLVTGFGTRGRVITSTAGPCIEVTVRFSLVCRFSGP
jgi:hypothetical protein